MNELALYCGAGGGLLGSALLGWQTIRAVEVEPYCREVVLRRQRDGVLPLFPIWDDIRTFDGAPWRGCVDIITAGFPCQPFSVAGQRKGEVDERNRWPDTIRVIREVRPAFAFLENVPGLLAHPYFGTILGDLAESGYDVRWTCLSAASVGAPHRRDRLWILAYANNGTRGVESGQPQDQRAEEPGAGGEGDVANTVQQPRDGRRGGIRWWSREPLEALQDARARGRQENGVPIPQSLLGRMADGVAYRVDRLRALGEGQVPGVVRAAWKLLGNP